MAIDVDIYYINWEAVPKKLLDKDFYETYVIKKNEYSSSSHLDELTEDDWISYVYVSDWVTNFDRSHSAYHCFLLNKDKLTKKVSNNFEFFLDCSFSSNHDDVSHFFNDYPQNWHGRISGRLISPNMIKEALELWQKHSFLDEMRKVYVQPESVYKISNFEEFSAYILEWVNILKNVPENNGIFFIIL